MQDICPKLFIIGDRGVGGTSRQRKEVGDNHGTENVRRHIRNRMDTI